MMTQIQIAPGEWLYLASLMPAPYMYFTYAQWNEAAANLIAAGSALSDTGTLGGDRHGSNFGVQVEYWWD